MSQYQNSPTGVLGDSKGSVDVARHWHDLSSTTYTSIPFGFGVPTFCRLLLGNTKFKLNTHTALQTNALVSPNFGSVNLKNAFFFAPLRLYVEGLFLNNFGEFDAVGNIIFPKFLDDANESEGAIFRGSLLDRLNFPAMTAEGMVFDPSVDFTSDFFARGKMPDVFADFNALRPIAYYSIIMHYFVDAYEKRLPFVHTSVDLDYSVDDSGVQVSLTHQDEIYDVQVDDLNTLLKQFRISSQAGLSLANNFIDSGMPVLVSQLSGQYTGFYDGDDSSAPEQRAVYNTLSSIVTLEGLSPVTYHPDLYNVWYDTDEVNKLVIQTSSNIQSIRLASAEYALGATLLVRGKRYTDYNNVITGAKLNLSDYPIFVGSDEFEVSFQDSVSTVSTEKAPQGTPVSRGFGHSFDTNEMNFETLEPGIFMCITTAIPRTALSNSVPKDLRYVAFEDIPNRFYDGVGFQSLSFGDMHFTNTHLDNIEIGSQAFFMEQMTAADVVNGLLATPQYRSYSFIRGFGLNHELLDPDRADPANVVEVAGSKYVYPRAYDYPFPAYAPIDVRGTAPMPYQDNIFVRIKFDLRCLQPLTNQVINTSM